MLLNAAMMKEDRKDCNEERKEKNNLWLREPKNNIQSEVQRGLSPKQNKVNVVVSNKSFIKRSEVGEVT